MDDGGLKNFDSFGPKLFIMEDFSSASLYELQRCRWFQAFSKGKCHCVIAACAATARILESVCCGL